MAMKASQPREVTYTVPTAPCAFTTTLRLGKPNQRYTDSIRPTNISQTASKLIPFTFKSPQIARVQESSDSAIFLP